MARKVCRPVKVVRVVDAESFNLGPALDAMRELAEECNG